MFNAARRETLRFRACCSLQRNRDFAMPVNAGRVNRIIGAGKQGGEKLKEEGYGPQLKPNNSATLVVSFSGRDGARLMSWRLTIKVEETAMFRMT